MNKEELSDRINVIFNIDLDFSRMKKEDLEQLLELIQDSNNLIRTGVKNIRDRARREYIEKPINKLLNDFSKRPLISISKDEKPIFPRIRELRNRLAERHPKHEA